MIKNERLTEDEFEQEKQFRTWILRRNDDRYNEYTLPYKHHPKEIVVFGTKEQTEFVAKACQLYDMPGCDYYYYVVEDSEDKMDD